MKITTLAIAAVSAIAALSCAVEVEDSEQDQSKEAYEDLVEPYRTTGTDPSFWSLTQIENEVFDCEALYYEKIENVFGFCTCRTQLLARRWGRDDYKRNSFAYNRKLAKTGRLAICLESETADFFEDNPDYIKEDQDEPIDAADFDGIDPVLSEADAIEDGKQEGPTVNGNGPPSTAATNKLNAANNMLQQLLDIESKAIAKLEVDPGDANYQAVLINVRSDIVDTKAAIAEAKADIEAAESD